jgi:hypothetical protein
MRMSLDVSLKRKKWISYDAGKTLTEEDEQVYWGNITHNLNEMAEEAGIYLPLWRPEEVGITKASQLIMTLKVGLAILEQNPTYFKTLNPPNDWGNYEVLILFVEDYLDACIKYPNANVRISR